MPWYTEMPPAKRPPPSPPEGLFSRSAEDSAAQSAPPTPSWLTPAETRASILRPHKRHRARTSRPELHTSATPKVDAVLWAATINCLWPWRAWEYPGWQRCAADALARSPDTIRRWLYRGTRGVPSGDARAISALLRARAAEELSLAAQWDIYAPEREALELANNWKGFRAQRLENTDTAWRSQPRKPKPPK